MTTGEILTLVGLLITLPTALWIIYTTLDGRMENKIEGLRRRMHDRGNELQKSFDAFEDDIDDLNARLARLEGRLNGRAVT